MQVKQSAKRQQLAECLQEVERLRKEEARLGSELDAVNRRVGLQEQRVFQAAQAAQAADAGLAPKCAPSPLESRSHHCP